MNGHKQSYGDTDCEANCRLCLKLSRRGLTYCNVQLLFRHCNVFHWLMSRFFGETGNKLCINVIFGKVRVNAELETECKLADLLQGAILTTNIKLANLNFTLTIFIYMHIVLWSESLNAIACLHIIDPFVSSRSFYLHYYFIKLIYHISNIFIICKILKEAIQ